MAHFSVFRGIALTLAILGASWIVLTTHFEWSSLSCLVPTASDDAHVAAAAITNDVVLKTATALKPVQPSTFDFWYAQHADEWLEPFVLPKYKLVFCKIPKVGSFGYLRILRWLSGHQDWERQPYFIENHRVANLTQLKHLPGNEALNIMFDDTWTKIVVVRDPLDRLISAYSDQLSRRRPDPPLLQALNLTKKTFQNVSFQDFVNRMQLSVTGHSELENPHWMRQARHCGLEHFHEQYQYMFYMPHDKAKHDKIIELILMTVAKRSPTALDVSAFPRTAEKFEQGHPSNHSHATLYEGACQKIQRLYAGDYELFGMPRPKCLQYSPFVEWPTP